MKLPEPKCDCDHDRLAQRVAKLEKKLFAAMERIAELEEENAQLWEKIIRLREGNTRLREENRRLRVQAWGQAGIRD